MGEGQKGSPKISDSAQVQARCGKIRWLVETGGGPELTDGASRPELQPQEETRVSQNRRSFSHIVSDFGVGSSTPLWSHCRPLSLWDSGAAYLSIVADGQETVSIIPPPTQVAKLLPGHCLETGVLNCSTTW